MKYFYAGFMGAIGVMVAGFAVSCLSFFLAAGFFASLIASFH